MHPYSHAALAIHLEPILRPANTSDYLWGAIVPDIRYLAGMRREQTHRPLDEIANWSQEYPSLASFVLGYRLHCLLDYIDVARVIGRAFPLNLIRRVRKLSNQQAGTLMELYFIRSVRIQPAFRGDHNPLLDRLGVRPEQCTALASGLREYFSNPGLETALAAFQKIGLVEDTRVGRYIHAARSMEKYRALAGLLVWGVRNAHIEQGAEQLVREELLRRPIP